MLNRLKVENWKSDTKEKKCLFLKKYAYRILTTALHNNVTDTVCSKIQQKKNTLYTHAPTQLQLVCVVDVFYYIVEP